MSLSAVLTARNNPLIEWSRATIDNVLLQGDRMYVDALNSGTIVLDQGVEFLSVNDLPKAININASSSSMFSYEIFDSRSVKDLNIKGFVKPAGRKIEAQNNNTLPVEAQNNNTLPVEAQNNNTLPVEAQNNNTLPIEAQNNNTLPVEAQNNNTLPVEAQNNNTLPIEAQNNNTLPIEAQNVNDVGQIWFINYKQEFQGVVLTDCEIESHYYDIHTALALTFLNDSYSIIIL